MNDDELDRCLAERGARWRADQPPPPEIDPAVLGGRSLPRWVAPAAAAAAVVAVVAGGAVLVGNDDSDGRRDPVDTNSPSLTSDPLAGVVPWKYEDPHFPAMPKFEEVYVPDPSYADGVEPCTAGQVTATSRVAAAAGTTYLDITFSAVGQARCSLSALPTVRLFEGKQPLDVEALPREGDGGWPGAVLVAGDLRGKLALAWTSLWCVAPVQNDRVVLEWPGGGTIEVDGFGQSPGCNNPGSGEHRGVDVFRFEPENWEVKDGPPVLSPIEARQVGFVPGAAGEPSTFVVELLAPERDVSLAICPDATAVTEYSYDDEVDLRYGLNCAAVPHKDADGVPYLPKGVPVRFAVQPVLAEGGVAAYTWVLHAPRPVSVELTVPGQTAPPPPVQVVDEEDARLFIDVSNQSFLDDPVQIQVLVDGVVLVDQEFVVEGQHTWVTFPIGLEPGKHTVRAVTEWKEIERSIVVPEESPVYAKIDYFHYESEGRLLTWDVQDSPFLYD